MHTERSLSLWASILGLIFKEDKPLHKLYYGLLSTLRSTNNIP